MSSDNQGGGKRRLLRRVGFLRRLDLAFEPRVIRNPVLGFCLRNKFAEVTGLAPRPSHFHAPMTPLLNGPHYSAAGPVHEPDYARPPPGQQLRRWKTLALRVDLRRGTQ
jgi:hypothetical protein